MFLASVRKELLEQVRTKRLLVLAVVLLFFGMTSPLMAKITPQILSMVPGAEAIASIIPEPTIMDAIGQYVKNVNQFGVLMALLLTMGMVAVEKDRGTAAMMLSKPLPRGVFLLAKFAATSLVFLGCMVLAGLGAYYYTVVLFHAPDAAAWVSMNLLLWVNMLVFVALTLFFSVLVRSQAAAAGLSVGVILVFSLISISPVLAKILPDRLVAWSAALFTGGIEPAWPALWVSLGLIAASLAGAWLVFRRQEI
jgi:ABC-2 type transport system permease protein